MSRRGALALTTALAAVLALPAPAGAHWPTQGSTPFTGPVFKDRALSLVQARSAQASPDAGLSNLALAGNADNGDGRVHSDLAFHGDLAYQGHFGGFRILDLKGQAPRVVTDFACEGPQNDVSVWDTGKRRLLFQSIDAGQSSESCDSTTVGPGGFEGIRIFDVTRPSTPRLIDGVPTKCGSHTHTLVPDRRHKRVLLYVQSYPLFGEETPPGFTGPTRCERPLKQISIVSVPYDVDGPGDARVKDQPLSDSTVVYTDDGIPGAQACHDVQIFEERDIAIGSCITEIQLWDISDPWNPTTNTARKLTQIREPGGTDQWEFIHSAFVAWDGDTFGAMDESGGGFGMSCLGAASTDSFYYFYELVRPGRPAPPLLGRYLTPREQAAEFCENHNANVIPVKGRDLASIASYQGGVSVLDFTDPRRPREIAFADLDDATGSSDEWSSYWYNGRIVSSGGLFVEAGFPTSRGDPAANRGLDVFRPTGSLSRAVEHARKWSYSNPQTQEEKQSPY